MPRHVVDGTAHVQVACPFAVGERRAGSGGGGSVSRVASRSGSADALVRRHSWRNSARLDRWASLTNRACSRWRHRRGSRHRHGLGAPTGLPARNASSTTGSPGSLDDATSTSLAAATVEPDLAARYSAAVMGMTVTPSSRHGKSATRSGR